MASRFLDKIGDYICVGALVTIVLLVIYLAVLSIRGNAWQAMALGGESRSGSAISAAQTIIEDASSNTALDGKAHLDTSTARYGYITASGDGFDDYVVEVSKGGKYYQYTLPIDGKAINIPVNIGSGDYEIFLATVGDNSLLNIVEKVTGPIKLEGNPYLASTCYAEITEAVKQQSKAVIECCESNLDRAIAVGTWVAENVAYDTVKRDRVSDIKGSYYPSNDKTLRDRKGICTDYASLVAAMLRSLGIETKVVMGTSDLEPNIYHAWNEVLIDGTWLVVDATFTSTGGNVLIQDNSLYHTEKVY